MENNMLLPIAKRVYATTLASNLVGFIPGQVIITEAERRRKYEISKRRDKIEKILKNIKKGKK